MSRRLAPGRLVLATHNKGKVREIGALVAPFGIEPVSAGDLGLPEPAETETTFAGNARIKALAAAAASGLPALADDSGIEVEALDGAPGVHTADWAETPAGRDYAAAMRKVWDAVEATGAPEPRRARFVCRLSLIWPDGHEEGFTGVAPGRLTWPPRGDHGFGFDPMFVPQGRTQTFAEMPPDEKHAISHRADAFRQLVAACLEDPT
jgi:XTP/dITP diphosphohydrolase